MTNETEALLILSGIPKLGAAKAHKLIAQFGSAIEVLNAKLKDLSLVLGKDLAELLVKWKQLEEWKQNLEWVEKFGVNLIAYTAKEYPKRLKEIADCPLILYVKGKLTAQDNRSIAIIGTRQCSIYGAKQAQKIAKELAKAGFTIVSGLAIGIDTAAHQGALQTGRTLAILGSGLADLYPKENYGLSKQIECQGAVISEFPMQTGPDRHHFPQRNRIIAAMTMATILIEAPLKSGSMIAVEKAQSYKRPVFALPGRVEDRSFEGNHLLIKTRQAELFESSTDILQEFDNLFR